MSELCRPLCREKQIQLLEILLCPPDNTPAKVPPLIFTYGLTSTGKLYKVACCKSEAIIVHVC